MFYIEIADRGVGAVEGAKTLHEVIPTPDTRGPLWEIVGFGDGYSLRDGDVRECTRSWFGSLVRWENEVRRDLLR